MLCLLEKPMKSETKEEIDKKFLTWFPRNNDPYLILLKGHLLIEEILNELLAMQLPHAEALFGSKGASLNFHQTTCMVEAITPQSPAAPWVWVAVKKLNKIRNYVAHKLNPLGIEHKTKDIESYVKNNFPEMWSICEKSCPNLSSFGICVMAIYCMLNPLIDSVAKNNA